MPYSNSKIVMGDKNNVPACTRFAQAATFLSALPLWIFRISETTFVSKIYIAKNRTSGEVRLAKHRTVQAWGIKLNICDARHSE